jgi:hypothetical protein
MTVRPDLGHSLALLYELFENSLKPLLTPDKWIMLYIFCIYHDMQNREKLQNMTKNMQNMDRNMTNMQENMQNRKENMQNMQENMQNMKENMQKLKENMQNT